MPFILGSPRQPRVKPTVPHRLHPMLRRYAKAVYPLNYSTNDVIKGGGLEFGASTAAPTWGARVGGYGLVCDGSNDFASGEIEALPGTYPVWMAGGFTYDIVPNANRYAFSLGGTTNAFLGIGSLDSGVVVGRVRPVHNGANAAVSGPAVEVDVTYNVAYIVRATNNHVMYVNGARYAVTTAVSGTWSTFDRVAMGGIYSNAAVTLFLDGALHWAAYGIEDPGDGFLQALSLNPYEYLFAADAPIWYSPAAAGGGFNAAWAARANVLLQPGIAA
ncbi:MAG: hypothetical protein ACYC2K_10080 [Gemmatimonadales bacterium]